MAVTLVEQTESSHGEEMRQKEPGPIMNPVLGIFVFLGLVVASNLVLDGLNYLLSRLL